MYTSNEAPVVHSINIPSTLTDLIQYTFTCVFSSSKIRGDSQILQKTAIPLSWTGGGNENFAELPGKISIPSGVSTIGYKGRAHPTFGIPQNF